MSVTIAQLAALAAAEKIAGLRFQKNARAGFRDRITVYRDGKLLFERFCYGESAGFVFEMRGAGAAEDGTLLWDYASCANSHKTQAPVRLSGGDMHALFFDDRSAAWEQDARLKSDAAHGYGLLSGVLGRLLRR